MKKWVRYIFIFLFMFCIVEFFGFSNTYGDSINNYMFSHAIVMGEIPYLDFNMVSTPLYAFIMSLGLFLWDNYLMFALEQSLLLTIAFYLLYEVYGKKSYIALLSVCLFAFFAFNATYNFLALFFLIFLIYLEEKFPYKDYFIGFILGCAILSKQTVGVMLVIPALIFYRRDIRKILRRIVGTFIPCFIFLIYLLFQKALYPFFDLCLFGLFDFSSKNGFHFSFYFLFSILLFCIQLWITLKRKKDIKNYYLLMGVSFVIPLFDLHHFSLYIFCFVLQLLPFITKYEDYFGRLALVLSIVVSIFIFSYLSYLLKPVFSTKIPKFQYTLNSSYDYQRALDNFKFFDQFERKLILSYGSTQYMVQYDISRNHPITYFDVLMYGNYGYRGSYKMIERVKEMKDVYILVDMASYHDFSLYNQFDKVVVDYVIKHYKKVDSWRDFNVYYKN